MSKHDELIKNVYEFAQNNSEKDDIHGFAHVLRVYNLCMKLSKGLDVNLKILKISALLHDIGRNKRESDKVFHNHAHLSSIIAKKFLESQDFLLTKSELSSIIHCIQAHSFSNNIIPQTIDAKILSDADKLDALGAIGLYRTIGFTIRNKGSLEDVIKHLEKKILKLKDQLYLKISKELASERKLIIDHFYKQIKEEI
jgi:uncharacterized protein